ncbi:right-handed parallel beta-helix repeat-containing protein [Nannocystis sp. ILAH1]|uniref:right-handed parallel beta-helix repeat-containing protein n=1 Tax=unclassified Nannocystis TaxID=2627009 RepID=UPI00227008D1|nr:MULTISPECIES: right-handed parallel beta-helix repeat-containing protein [unclassified Nannocystis]MCY0986273.1 right-handed parallel beta-helix repeat-containing protein [Nannocystis sp. ILAH1]MCY1068868.1 right-handed parallel beta-helix repeat-containing protein [Nannocystis sp. RBIL2]
MTRQYWTVAILACAPLVAGCPPTYTPGETESGTETDSETSETSNTTTPDVTTTSTTTVTPTTDTDTSTTTTSTSTTGPTTGNMGCAGDGDCSDPAKPFCVDQACVGCGGTPDPDATCAEVDADTPVCNPDSGACVVCTPENKGLCADATPVCDAATNECVGCVEHDDCPDSACNGETGACFALEYVVYVDGVAQCDIGDGTMAAPFCQITHALDHVAMNDPSLGWTIKVKTGNYIQPSLVVPEASNLAIVGDGGIAKIRSNAGPTLQINPSSKVLLGKLNLASNADDTGLTCTGSQLQGTDLTFSLNRQGYVGTDCTAHFNRSVFYKNTSGGLSAFGAGATAIVNSYISNNGSNAESNYGGLLTGQGHELSLVYSTVVNNLSEVGARSLLCMPDAGTTTVRNSVIIAFVAPSIDCATATFENSAIDEGKTDGDTNLAATMADAMTWFEGQVGGVYKAKLDTPIATLAVWKDGDPATDFNGDPRPATDGETDYAGADRPAR